MKRGMTAMGKGAEFDAIRSLVERWGARATGIGDDAALVDVPRGDRLVASTDAFVEGVHFEPAWLNAHEIGYRAATAALSDLAAMAADPLGLLFAVNLPERWRSRLNEISDGVGEAARAAGALIIGGNISSGTELSITTTVLGHAFAPLRRSGAQVGDRLYVTGALGGPGAALAAWREGREPLPEHRFRFAHPVARIREARILADRGAHACIDISDGIGSEIDHLAAASGVSFAVELDQLPLVAGVSVEAAIQSGEEYELLVAAPSLDVNELSSILGCRITEIGQCVAVGGTSAFDSPGHSHLS